MILLVGIIGSVCALIAFVCGYVRGLRRGAIYGVELIARDNVARLAALGIDRDVWMAAGAPAPGKSVLQ